MTPTHKNATNQCHEVCVEWPWAEEAEQWVSHLLNAVASMELSHAYIEPSFSQNAQLFFRADGIVIPGVAFSSEQYSKLLENLRSKFLIVHQNHDDIEGIIEYENVFYWVGLLKTLRGTSLSLHRRRGKNNPPVEFPAQARDVWQQMMQKPNGLIVLCHRGWSLDNTILRILESLVQEDQGKSRHALVSESLQNISLRDDISSFCIATSSRSWHETLHKLVMHDFDVLGLSGRNENFVMKEAITTALEDRRVLASVSFPDAVEALLWLANDSQFDASQVAQVLLGVIGDYQFLPRNCPACFEISAPTLEQTHLLTSYGFDLSNARFGRGRGCGECFQTGFMQPWLQVTEALFVDQELAKLLTQKPTREVIVKALRKRGWKSRLQQAIEYSMRGETLLEEALRIGLARKADL